MYWLEVVLAVTWLVMTAMIYKIYCLERTTVLLNEDLIQNVGGICDEMDEISKMINREPNWSNATKEAPAKK